MEYMVVARAVIGDDCQCIRFVESYFPREVLTGGFRSFANAPSRRTRQIEEIGILAVFIENSLGTVFDLRGGQDCNCTLGELVGEFRSTLRIFEGGDSGRN